MTNSPGEDQDPQDPYGQHRPGEQQPGYWEQQAQAGGQPYYAPQAPMQYAPDHPKATTALVLGILGIVVCGILAPFAWVMGKRTMEEIDASHGTLGGRGAANAGYVLGIVGTVILGLALLFLVLVFGIAILGAVTASTASG